MKKKTLALLLALVMVFSLVACAPASEPKDEPAVEPEEPADTQADTAGEDATSAARPVAGKEDLPTPEDLKIPDGETITIGYFAQNETIQFCVYMSNALKAEAEKYGGQVEVIMVDARSIAANQVSQAEDMVVKGVDAVIFNAIDQEASSPAITILHDAGIPIILVNTPVSNGELATAYVGCDDTEAGMITAQLMSEALEGEGNINIMKGMLGDPANERRMEGATTELKNHPGLTVLSAQAADWDRGKAMSLTEDWISGVDEFDGIICMNDEMAISASNALIAAGLNDVKLIGVDGIGEALDLIKSGAMYGTVFQDAATQGIGALNVAVAAVLGEDVNKDYIIPYEGITAENVDEYINRQ